MEEDMVKVVDEILNLKDDEYDMDTEWLPRTYVRVVFEDGNGQRFIVDGPFQMSSDGPEIILKSENVGQEIF